MSMDKVTAVKGASSGEKARRGLISVLANALMIIFSLTCIFPIIWMFYSSFKLQKDFNTNVAGLPANPTIQNYTDVMGRQDTNILRAVGNSFIVTAISIVFIVLFGFIVGYLLGRVKFRGSKLVYGMFLLGMIIPIHALMVPEYVLFKRFGMTDNLVALAIPYIAFGLPIAIFLMQGYIQGVPNSIEEAAAIDGSSFTRTLFSIMMPISKPILATIAIIQTFACWNEFSFALVLISNAKYRTVPLELAMLKGQYSSNYPRIFATMLITMIPTVIFYFIFSKEIMKGMVAGAVKG